MASGTHWLQVTFSEHWLKLTLSEYEELKIYRPWALSNTEADWMINCRGAEWIRNPVTNQDCMDSIHLASQIMRFRSIASILQRSYPQLPRAPPGTKFIGPTGETVHIIGTIGQLFVGITPPLKYCMNFLACIPPRAATVGLVQWMDTTAMGSLIRRFGVDLHKMHHQMQAAKADTIESIISLDESASEWTCQTLLDRNITIVEYEDELFHSTYNMLMRKLCRILGTSIKGSFAVFRKLMASPSGVDRLTKAWTRLEADPEVSSRLSFLGHDLFCAGPMLVDPVELAAKQPAEHEAKHESQQAAERFKSPSDFPVHPLLDDRIGVLRSLSDQSLSPRSLSPLSPRAPDPPTTRPPCPDPQDDLGDLDNLGNPKGGPEFNFPGPPMEARYSAAQYPDPEQMASTHLDRQFSGMSGLSGSSPRLSSDWKPSMTSAFSRPTKRPRSTDAMDALQSAVVAAQQENQARDVQFAELLKAHADLQQRYVMLHSRRVPPPKLHRPLPGLERIDQLDGLTKGAVADTAVDAFP